MPLLNYKNLIACIATCLTLSSQASGFSFGLWGDMPYQKAGDNAKMPAVLASINNAKIDFSIFVGDIKDGDSKCTDEVFTEAIKLFDSMRHPVVYIPNKLLPNLTRLQTFGSPNLHWVKVNVDLKRESVFDIEPVIVQHAK